MKPFLQRFYDAVDDNLQDPHTSRRLTKDKKLQLLRTQEVSIWESLLNVTGDQSTLGRVEGSITLRDGVSFYPLPGNFRQFVFLQQWAAGDRQQVLQNYRTVSMYDQEPGVEIIDPQRGMIVRPAPVLTADSEFTLGYMKGPIPLHYAKAAGVTVRSVVFGVPDTASGGGECVLLENYYVGALLRIYSADTGAGQVGEIISFKVGPDGVGTATIRHPFTQVPTGEVWYEICPALPEPYDDVYAIDVAIRNLGRRGQMRRKASLLQDRNQLWSACVSYYGSSTMERAPKRAHPYNPGEPDPYQGMG